MGKVEEKKLNKLNSMLEAARQLFTDQGISNTSVSDITKQSGVAKGTFYLYFTDKYDIRNKLVAFESSKLIKTAIEKSGEQTFSCLEDLVIFIVETLLDDLVDKPDLIRLISKNLSWGVLKKEISRPFIDELDISPIFNTLTGKYSIPQKESEIMLYLIVELVGSSCYSAVLYQDPCSLEELKPYLFDTVRHLVSQFRPEQPPEE